MDDVAFQRNRADAATIFAHLRRCDGDFATRLSERVCLEAYSTKLAANTHRAEAWVKGGLVGLVALYAPDANYACFISNVSVDPLYRRRRLAETLVRDGIEIAAGLGAVTLVLEVDVHSPGPRQLYSKLNFVPLAGQPTRWSRNVR